MITIILSGVAIFGLIYSLIRKGAEQKIITLLLSTSVLLTLVQNKYIYLLSALLLLSGCVLVTVYAIKQTNIYTINRFFMATSSIILMLDKITDILPMQKINQLRLSMIVPILLFVISLIIYKKNIPKEFGFMLILIALSLSKFIDYLILLF